MQSGLKSIQELVLESLNEDFLREVHEQAGKTFRSRIFHPALVIWLMIQQRLNGNATLSSALAMLKRDSNAMPQVGSIGTLRRELISPNTGGYSQARGRLPIEVVESACDKLNEALSRTYKEQLWHNRRVFIVDGMVCELPSNNELRKHYPSCKNQHGKSPWPKIRACVMHDAVTGVALRPDYAPMYGQHVKGEVQLLRDSLHRIPSGSVTIADRLYGTFIAAYEIDQHGILSVVRLTDDRARKFKALLKQPGEVAVTWEPSKKEKHKYTGLSPDACISGRFIWQKVTPKGYRSFDLYIFTTLELPTEEIVACYGQRWNIELDIRTLKSTLDLRNITARRKDIVEKELILAITTYNLVRHIIAAVAIHSNIDPRRVSFSRVCNSIEVYGHDLLSRTIEEQERVIRILVRDIPRMVNPKRERPSEPRKVLRKREKFPYLHESRARARKRLNRQTGNDVVN